MNTTEKIVLSHIYKTQMHFSRMYFYPGYSGYRSQTRDGCLSPAQTTARSTANSSVSMSTLLRYSRISYDYTLQYRRCSSLTTVRISNYNGSSIFWLSINEPAHRQTWIFHILSNYLTAIPCFLCVKF